jgi:hypothetical protein
MKNVIAKLVARRAAAAAARKRPAPVAVAAVASAELPVDCAPAVCELCEADWGSLTAEEIAELLVTSGRFPEEEREALLAMPRELLVAVFCGCSAKLRLAPPPPPATRGPRQARR